MRMVQEFLHKGKRSTILRCGLIFFGVGLLVFCISNASAELSTNLQIRKETDPQKSPLSSAIDDLFDKAPSAKEVGGKMSSAIDDLFDKAPSAEEVGEKMNSAIDGLLEQASSARETAEKATEKAAKKANDAISELAGKIPSADEAAGKVNDALDSLGSEMKKFSDALDSKIQAFTRKIKGED